MADPSVPEKRAPRKIEIGAVFERLTVVARDEKPYHWLCQCSCGNPQLRPVRDAHLRSGNTRSCGCLQIESVKARATHGEARVSHRSPEYTTWRSMIARCYGPARNSRDVRYSGRGIEVCQRWRDSYQSFLADMGRRPERGYTIERKENNGNYEPGNCVWATWKQQQNNRSSNHLITHDGQTLTMMQWAEKMGLPFEALKQRIRRGWPTEKALTEPVNPNRSRAMLKVSRERSGY